MKTATLMRDLNLNLIFHIVIANIVLHYYYFLNSCGKLFNDFELEYICSNIYTGKRIFVPELCDKILF